jgi:hypothetical protein
MVNYNHSNNQLVGLDRCPHCGVATPRVSLRNHHYSSDRFWSLYICETCFAGIMAESGNCTNNVLPPYVARTFPSVQSVPEELPSKSKAYLSQAVSSIHSPDGAAMLLGSAVDAMLKDKGLSEGSVYARIDLAKKSGILTEDMAEWAHSVRLGSNRPRHADVDDAHVTPEEASQALEYVMTLAQLLYVLPKRIAVGRAKVASQTVPE